VVLSLTALSQLAVGLLLYRRLESQLEADLARRLVHVSTLLGYSVDAALVVQFREGDEGLPAYQLVRRRLSAQAEAAGVSRAYVFDARSQTLVDTEDQRPGRVRHRLLAHRAELAQAFAGNAVATRLYADEEDRLRLSAFAPLRDRDRRVTAVVGVDAPPAFFAALAAVRREMALLGLAGIGLVALAGTLIVRQVGARLGRLREMVTGAKGGDPRPAGQPHGADQIGALGRDLEQLVGAMVASREYQAAVLGSVDVGLLTCGADDRVTLANARLHQLLALGDDALIGRAVQDLLAGEPALAVFARAAAHAEAPLRAELPLRGGPVAGGRLLAASASRLVEGGRPSGLVLSLLDVTELRQAERRARENERLAALGGMAGGLLHELGNPLAALTMYLDLLSPLTPAGEPRELLDRAIREDARLREFLEDFRVFAGLAALRVETVELLQLVQLAAEPLAWPPEIARAVRASGSARGDRRLLAHAVRNLLRNALEALPRGGCVRLALACEGGEARVVVSDDGPGLTSEQLEKILEPFHTTKPHGSGLGLLIARRVAELHGGRLEAGAAAGSGATFTLRWPLARPAAE
jgi:signal transduction histidine kinase